MRADLFRADGEIPRRSARALRRTIRAALTAAGGGDDWRLEVALVPPATIRALNRRYRDRDTETNVLSFPGTHRPPTPRGRLRDLGQIVIAPAVAAREARQHRMAAEVRLAHLVIHGVLHLLGFDHVTGDAERSRMEALETRALDSLDPSTYRALAALLPPSAGNST